MTHDRTRPLRRDVLRAFPFGFAAGFGWAMPTGSGRPQSTRTQTQERKFTMDLCPGRIGVSVDQSALVELATKYGFESIEPLGGFLRSGSEEERKRVAGKMEQYGLTWGAAGLPVEFRQDDETFQSDLKDLPTVAEALAAVGGSRIGTYIMPTHETRTYLQNFEIHASRLKQVASILADHGISLGLEYVGPRTLWSSRRYAFVHTLAETRELISAIGEDNVGYILDCWHWYTAEETAEDLRTLKAAEIVAVDLNDAPAGIAVEEQVDNRRELPAATGVIDVRQFLTCLVDLGYDGPVRAEPFNQPLRELDDDPAVEATAAAMKKAFQTIE